MPRYRFLASVTTADYVKQTTPKGPELEVRPFAAGDEVDGDRLLAGCLESLLRTKQVERLPEAKDEKKK